MVKKVFLSPVAKRRGLCLLLAVGIFLFIWELGSTGIFDETPPLFAAASRSMHISGDWLTPRVNGMPRFDKPPLIYWLMGFIYSLPGQEIWDPLGSLSARIPSAIASLLMMLFIGETLMSFPQGDDQSPRRTAIIASLVFALSPLVIIWSRIAVSDALFCGTLGISLLYQWRRYAQPSSTSWLPAWIILAFAVLTKGPAAVVITGMVLVLFGFIQQDFRGLISRIKPIRGISLTALISAPWYLLELLVEGKPFWDSFFGYHNFQRLTSVVNSHYQPWWFFGLILIIASLPYTPFLLISIFKEILNLKYLYKKNIKLPEAESLNRFAFSWLIAIFILFTLAATKLPSYWLPATPAASILISLSHFKCERKTWLNILPFAFSLLILLAFSIALYSAPNWIEYINDPEMPNLSQTIISSRLYLRGSLLILFSTFISCFFIRKLKRGRLLLIQAPLVLFHSFVFLPFLEIGDNLRQFPLRKVSELLVNSRNINEPIAMVGINKPSIHFYTQKVVLYESNDEIALINLADRLSNEKRDGWEGIPISSKDGSNTFLLVIDELTSRYDHWQKLNPEVLGQFGIYKIWRLNRNNLETRSNKLRLNGGQADWRVPRPERL